MKYEFITINNELFVIKRRFKIEDWQKVLDRFGAKTICEAYHCEQILRSRDGFFYLVDKVEDAKII